jgi:hypothetical protein
MRTAYLMGITALLLAAAACGSDTVETPTGGTGTGAGATTSSSTGMGGDMTTSTATTGTGGMGGGGQGGSMCPGFGDPCTNCTAAQCQATYCDCFNNPDCVALVQCLQGCTPGDAACQQTCFTDNQNGISDSVLLADCVEPNCNGPTECNGSGQALGPCEECLFTSCPAEMNTCLANAECYALITCAQACPPGDQACINNCGLMHTGGINDAQGVLNCANNACAAVCN